MADPLTVGSTYEWDLNQAKKNGVVWDLTGATVTILLKRPSGGWSELAITSLYDPTNGRGKRAGDGSELTEAGTWQRVWRIRQGAIDIRYPPISFVVKAAF